MALISSAAVTTVNRSPVQASLGTPFTGLKSSAGFPVTKKNNDITSITSNGSRVHCMQVWPPIGKKKFETLSYLPPLTEDQLLKEVEYLLRKGWIPCVEFELEKGFVYREHNNSPGYYDGRYWTMWRLPLFGSTDAAQVLKEVNDCKEEYPEAFIRIIGFDNVRQVQCISFIAHTPKVY